MFDRGDFFLGRAFGVFFSVVFQFFFWFFFCFFFWFFFVIGCKVLGRLAYSAYI